MSTCDLKPQQPKCRLPVEVGSLELGAGAQPGSGAAAREFYEGKGRQKILAKAKEAVSSLVRMKKKSGIFFMVKRMMVNEDVVWPGCLWVCLGVWCVLIMFEQKGLSVPFGGETRESWHLSFILGLSKRLSSENLMAIARLANARDARLIFL